MTMHCVPAGVDERHAHQCEDSGQEVERIQADDAKEDESAWPEPAAQTLFIGKCDDKPAEAKEEINREEPKRQVEV